MNLCVDIGNTRVKFGIYDGDKLIKLGRTAQIEESLFLEIKKHKEIKACILSSTRNLDENELNFFKKNFNTIFLDHSTNLPIINKYETPETLGKDRLAAAVATHSLFPNQSNIFIDCGTCLTYNYVSDKGEYMGGNISPGLSMRLKAMHHFTDKLPLVEKAYNEDLFGTTTEKALQNGALKGAIYEISAFIVKVIEKYGYTNVILTGGDSNIFVKHLNFKIFAFPNLVLLGLNEILKFNADHKLH